MNKIICVILFFYLNTSWSQKVDKYSFVFFSEEMTKVVTAIEIKFKIKYSYINEDINKNKITLNKSKYSLEELNQEIENQTKLKIVKIDERFYSITKNIQTDSIKNYELDNILIEGVLAKGINKSNQKYIIYPQKINMLPGITDADVLLSIQQLPGVKSPNETATGLHVRGGTPDQNLILWDGIRLYHPGHLFGMISGINSNINQTVYHYNKGTNPKYGERVSSILDIKTSDEIANELKIKAGINALNADMYLQIPLIKNKLGLQLSGRKSYTELVQSATFNQLATKVFQNTNFENFSSQNEFGFQDYSAKLNFKPNAKSELSFSTIFIDNFLDFNNKLPNNAVNNQKMNILNQGYSLNWNYKFSEKWGQNILLYYSLYDFDYQKKVQFSDKQFESFTKLNRIVDSGFEWNFSNSISRKLNLDYGYQLSGNDVSHLLNNNNQNIGIELSTKQIYNLTNAGYTNLKYDHNHWNVQTGIRYNYFNTQESGSIEPRIFIQKKFFKNYILQASFERKSQLINQFREDIANDLSLENYIWSLSNQENYPIQKVNHFTTGLIYKQKNWLVDIDLYYKTIDGITTFTFGFANQVDTEIRPGDGFSKGLDLLIQKSAPTWRIWMTYSYQDSQNRFDLINDNNYFETNSNIKHAFNLSFNNKWNQFSVALGWFLHSGKPYSLLNDSNQIASFNSEHLTTYHRMDISVIYEFYKVNDNSIKMGISFYNIYNNKIIISKDIVRSYVDLIDYTVPKYTVENFYSLGMTPNLFLKFSF